MDEEDEDETLSPDIPFCRFLMLVSVWRRAPSSGAKGWRAIVAIVTG